MKVKIKYFGACLFVIFLVALIFLPISRVNAAALTGVSDTFSNMAPSATTSTETIVFTTPTGVAAGQTITITWPAGFTGISSIVYGDCTMKEGAVSKTLGTSASGATWGVAGSGQVLTITSGTDTVTATHVVTIVVGVTNHVVNPDGSANPYTISIGGTMTDSGSVAAVIAANTVSVGGTVNESLTFNLSSNTIAFGALTTDTAATNASITMQVGTNCTSGATVTITGTTLTAGNGTDTITACTTGCGTPWSSPIFGFNERANANPTSFGADKSGGAGGYGSGYGTVDSYKFHTGDNIVSISAGVATTTYTLAFIVKVPATQPAGTYTTNLTYTAAASF